MRRSGRREEGSVGLELVLVFPALLFTLLAAIQVALVAHGAHVVETAAREGAQAARLAGTPEPGRLRAQAFVQRLGAQIVLQPTVAARDLDGAVEVEVAGRAVGILPALRFPLHAVSSAALERFDPAGRAP